MSEPNAHEWKAIRDPLSGIGHLKCGSEMMITDLDFDLCSKLADSHNDSIDAATARELHSYDVAKLCREQLAAAVEALEKCKQIAGIYSPAIVEIATAALAKWGEGKWRELKKV